ncbi:BRISC and BRCA1-A complex member 2 [Frankliniella fusca]|uniref:BRISC and BRCA1-A complex member 2 n=1 Tax=Frankliniella fusca TaxID=407009 RepID=A0AAE1H9Q5_9NEOP|nr:BRISC and BRCA1-A complex member 2 [Frankliniella fusca]
MQIFDHHFRSHLDVLLNTNFTGFVLVWEILFDSTCPEQAPDFLFDDDSFTSFLTVDILTERVPSLTNWNVNNQECLSKVLQELLNLYTLHQLQRLEKDGSPVGDQCSKLMQEFELEEKQLQVLSGDSPVINQNYYGGSTRPPHGTISIMFLNLEDQLPFEDIPKCYRQMALQFSIREYTSNLVFLHISSTFRHMLGQQAELEIPTFTKLESLSSYFRQFRKIVLETFQQITESYEKRQEFHLKMLQNLSSTNNVSIKLLESDMPHFTSSTYIIEVNDYPILAIIQTPSYSLGDPKIIMRTINGHSKELSISATWDVQKSKESIMNYLMDLIDGDSDSS